MLNRQKTLLNLFVRYDRPIHRMELTKLCFLLRHEYSSGGGNAFYDFVPYRFGPFSFAMYQEIGKLEAQQFIRAVSDKAWEIVPGNLDYSLPTRSVTRDIDRLAQRFSKKTLDQIVDYVYESYPEFTVNSEIRRLKEKPVSIPAIYTAGYEGLSIDSFLNMLVQNGIERLIDVRQNPIARRYGFHKSTMSRITRQLGIEYDHQPRLGIHSKERRDLHTQADYEKLFRKYADETLQTELDSIITVSKMIKEKPSVLVCMEADPNCCHRSRLADKLAKVLKLPISHLRVNECLNTTM